MATALLELAEARERSPNATDQALATALVDLDRLAAERGLAVRADVPLGPLTTLRVAAPPTAWPSRAAATSSGRARGGPRRAFRGW